MSHKSGHIIINSILPVGGSPIVPLAGNTEAIERLNDIRSRDQYTIADRLYLGYIVGVIADDPAD